MKQTLLLILTIALGIGCKDKRTQTVYIKGDYIIWGKDSVLVEGDNTIDFSKVRGSKWGHLDVKSGIWYHTIQIDSSECLCSHTPGFIKVDNNGTLYWRKSSPTKWTKATDAKRGGLTVRHKKDSQWYYEGDTIGGGKRKLTDKHGNLTRFAVDSLGNIIEDTLPLPLGSKDSIRIFNGTIAEWVKKDSLP